MTAGPPVELRRGVFADTAYWIALFNRKDSLHAKAKALSQAMQSRLLITTDEVLTEFLAYFASGRPEIRKEAAATPGGHHCGKSFAEDLAGAVGLSASELAYVELQTDRPRGPGQIQDGARRATLDAPGGEAAAGPGSFRRKAGELEHDLPCGFINLDGTQVQQGRTGKRCERTSMASHQVEGSRNPFNL